MLKVANCKSIFIDGTFKKCPPQFKQFVTIHGFKGLEKVPLVYCLLPDKKKATYECVLKVVAAEVQKVISAKKKNTVASNLWSPEHVTSDFEQSLIEAVRIAFPKAKLHGCTFHHGGSLYRNLQNHHLNLLYNSNEEFQRKMRLLFALQFLDPSEVKQQFANLIGSGCFFQFETVEMTERLRSNIENVSELTWLNLDVNIILLLHSSWTTSPEFGLV